MSIAFFSSPPPTHLPSLSPPQSNAKAQLAIKFCPILRPSKTLPFFLVSTRATDDGAGATVTVEEGKTAAATTEEKVSVVPLKSEEAKGESLESNGSPPPPVAAAAPAQETVSGFLDPRWVNGTWDLKQFEKDGKTNWDAVIDAEAKRRKGLEDNPESSSNEEPVVFDTSIIPWWAWIKRYHLPEAELLNGRAAMIGFFMAYLVDSLTGVGLVDQMSNFFCKTLLFVAVVGVLLIRKNEDIQTVKKLVEESTFYDKQWQATWKDENSSSLKKDQ